MDNWTRRKLKLNHLELGKEEKVCLPLKGHTNTVGLCPRRSQQENFNWIKLSTGLLVQSPSPLGVEDMNFQQPWSTCRTSLPVGWGGEDSSAKLDQAMWAPDLHSCLSLSQTSKATSLDSQGSLLFTTTFCLDSFTFFIRLNIPSWSLLHHY